MRAFRLLPLAVLPQLATVCLAVPLVLRPRSQDCSNAPNTVAGTLLERAQGDVWCAPNTKTWVSIEFGKKMASTIVTELLIDSFNMISDTTQANGDGPIVKGQFLFTRYGLAFAANNANNHQLTREVLKGAITAVWQYMRNRQYHLGGQGLVKFQIFDGVNQVGTGSIKTAPSG